MNLILFEPEEVAIDGAVRLAGTRARHVREVLQATPGEVIRVGLIDGPLGTATVIEDGKEMRLQCRFSPELPPVPRVDLLLAMPRPKVMNRLWPVLASLGVGRVIIFNAWKTERNYFDTHVLEPVHIRAGLLEGLQQARDTRLPQVSVHRQFNKLMENELAGFGPYAARWVAHPGARRGAFENWVTLPRAARVLLAIGPEGGWTPYELERLASGGFECVSWGTRTLRTDTACAVLLGLTQARLADYQSG